VQCDRTPGQTGAARGRGIGKEGDEPFRKAARVAARRERRMVAEDFARGWRIERHDGQAGREIVENLLIAFRLRQLRRDRDVAEGEVAVGIEVGNLTG